MIGGAAGSSSRNALVKRGITDPAELSEIVAKCINMAERIALNFTDEEINNLIEHVIKNGKLLQESKLNGKQLGQAVAGVYNKRTGEFYEVWLNALDDKYPEIFGDRINSMPPKIKNLTETNGPGTHAEVYAVADAMDKKATPNDLLVYVNWIKSKTNPITENPFRTCIQCDYILDGYNILSDIFD